MCAQCGGHKSPFVNDHQAHYESITNNKNRAFKSLDFAGILLSDKVNYYRQKEQRILQFHNIHIPSLAWRRHPSINHLISFCNCCIVNA